MMSLMQNPHEFHLIWESEFNDVMIIIPMIITGFHYIWDVILPIDELHHFSRWAHCTTNQIIINHH